MSGNMCTKPGVSTGGRLDVDEKEEKVVDIYVRGDSVIVYENPWVEGASPPNIPATARDRLPVPAVPVSPEKRNPFRAAAVTLGLLSLILLAGIISLGIRFRKDKTSWNKEKSSLRAASTNMTEERERLEATNSKLIGERDELLKRLCEETSCSDNWKKWDCSCYSFSFSKKTWWGSRDECEEQGAHLVIISSKEEEAFVIKGVPRKSSAWIGLSFRDEEDTWEWLDGTQLNPEQYSPDDSRSSSCVVIEKSKNRVSDWRQEKCWISNSWICEKEIL